MANKLIKKYRRGIGSVVAFLVLWEIAGRFGWVNDIFISTPSKVFFAGLHLFFSGAIYPHVWASMEAFGLGFSCALLGAVIIGLIAGYYENIYEYLLPYMYALSALPKVAIVPLIIIWFGVGIYSKIAVVFLMSFVPILISTVDGARNSNRKLIAMAKTFDQGDVDIIKTVIFFEALPFIFSGVRISIGRGITGLVIAEVFGYGKGLGYLVSYYGGSFQTANLLFVVSLLLLITLLLVRVVAIIEKKIIIWK